MGDRPSLLPLADLALRFGRIDRRTMHPDGVTWESDSDHTIMLILVACSIAAQHPELKLDLGLVAQLATVHDLPEVYAGDTDTFRAAVEGRETDQREREEAARWRIAQDCAAWPWVIAAMWQYHAQRCPEARFIRYVDKILPRLTNTLNGGAAIRWRGYSKEHSFAHDRRLIDSLAAEYLEFASVLDPLLRDACDESECAWRAND